MTQSRTHNCGELRLADAGKTVTLAGWLEKWEREGHIFVTISKQPFQNIIYGAL